MATEEKKISQEEMDSRVNIAKSRFYMFLTLAMREYSKFHERDLEMYKEVLDAQMKSKDSRPERRAFEKEIPKLISTYKQNIERVVKEANPEVNRFFQQISQHSPEAFEDFASNINFLDALTELAQYLPKEQRTDVQSYLLEKMQEAYGEEEKSEEK